MVCPTGLFTTYVITGNEVRGSYESLRGPCEQAHSLEQDNLSAFKALVGWGLLMGLMMGAWLYFAVNELEVDSYERGNYAIEQCYSIPGDYPDPNMSCPRSDQTGPAR